VARASFRYSETLGQTEYTVASEKLTLNLSTAIKIIISSD
jgi:hypothetical protein